MIVAERKTLDEIKEMLKRFKKILNVGCGGCTSICLAGGQKEVDLLNEELKKLFTWSRSPSRSMDLPLSASVTPIFIRIWMSGRRPMRPCSQWPVARGFNFLPNVIPRNPYSPL